MERDIKPRVDERIGVGVTFGQQQLAVDYQQSLPVEMTRGSADNILPVCGESIPSVLMAQQLPPLSKFSGEINDGDMDTFQEWIEQFEMIASICG